ncbi:MAG: hypothetical protein M3Y65_04565 [Pseudomonadota bacterium]|nr:hypothetical protein [Pseudomonadota bacterium]
MNDNHTTPAARTDDLLASGAESKDGAKGFTNPSTAAPLITGMEGISDAATDKGNRQSDTQDQQDQQDQQAQQQQAGADNAGQSGTGQGR